MSNRRQAFTLIELLVAIGIIAALGALFSVGIRALSGSASNDNTRVLLQNYASMLAELRATVGNNRPLPTPPSWQSSGGGNVAPGSEADFWYVLSGTKASPGVLAPPTNILTADVSKMPAFRNTHRAIQLLGRCPNNRTALSKLPSDRMVLLKDLAAAGPTDTFFVPGDLPIVRDAWNNPIIFVPASGLGMVKINDGKNPVIIRSSGIYTSNTALKSDDRPFFASAGPDGDFAMGDDNLYSFQD